MSREQNEQYENIRTRFEQAKERVINVLRASYVLKDLFEDSHLKAIQEATILTENDYFGAVVDAGITYSQGDKSREELIHILQNEPSFQNNFAYTLMKREGRPARIIFRSSKYIDFPGDLDHMEELMFEEVGHLLANQRQLDVYDEDPRNELYFYSKYFYNVTPAELIEQLANKNLTSLGILLHGHSGILSSNGLSLHRFGSHEEEFRSGIIQYILECEMVGKTMRNEGTIGMFYEGMNKMNSRIHPDGKPYLVHPSYVRENIIERFFIEILDGLKPRGKTELITTLVATIINGNLLELFNLLQNRPKENPQEPTHLFTYKRLLQHWARMH